MTSLWLADRVVTAMPSRVGVPGQPSADVVVVGAGITGLVTAALLARAGKDVLVLEARTVGACTTGNTTGKISLLQGSKLSKITAKHGSRMAAAYVQGNREGQAWLLRHCESRGVAFQQEDAYTYAQSGDGLPTVQAELAAAKGAGLDAEWVDDAGTPFPYRGGVRLRDQAQIDPMPLLDSLVAELEHHGGRLVQGARVHRVSGAGSKLKVHVRNTDSEDTVIRTGQLVLATGMPILDRGGFFARLKAQRSYCMAFDVPGDITRGMYLAADSPTRSLRYAPTANGEALVVGGAGHPVGREKSPSEALDELAAWTTTHFPGAVRTHVWSAQDYSPVDELPYVGPILPRLDSICVATGFDKWGMTNGVAAALALSSRILGGRMDWSDAFASWSPHELAGIATLAQANLEVGFNLAKGWVTPIAASTGRPPTGWGVVSGPPWHLRARSVVDGVERVVSPVCPHLGGIVNWNDADMAWECPLHGSRFAPDGTRLEGPATDDLTPCEFG
ncbi:FAD-dependent oxidoreductase [Mycobacterium antarcticum]|uniref:FAD-dependent oxidoreductase n=1 Tax=Mycolicibacterium sp. TUM20983 TaxID=3023369 RepID=UPI00239C2A11|nr:FAD-dependent oxidoreductase [Mycolicibacterium sp. TUM20983]GLP78320.1 FAD-dependent oxidoreductase [Mycolicibacterium sp. TUM20983]